MKTYFIAVSAFLIDQILKNKASGLVNDANFISAFLPDSLSLCVGFKIFSGVIYYF
jgi:hypothetical protein